MKNTRITLLKLNKQLFRTSLAIFLIVTLLSTHLVPLSDAHDTIVVDQHGVIFEIPMYSFECTYENGKLTFKTTYTGSLKFYGTYTTTVVLPSHKHWYDYASAAALGLGGIILGALLKSAAD